MATIPIGQAASLNWGNCTCNIGCDTKTTATLRKINILKKSTSNNLGQTKAMRYAQFCNNTPGLETVNNKKQVFVSRGTACVLPGRSVVDNRQCGPVCDWTTATKTKFNWLTGCPNNNNNLPCNGHNQTTIDNPAFLYPYPNSMFVRYRINPVTMNF